MNEYNKTETDSQIKEQSISFYIYKSLYIYKMATMTLYARQQKRHKCKEQTFGLCRKMQGWDDLRD